MLLKRLLCLLTLSSFCINGIEEQCTQFPEIITSRYEMNLKLGPGGDDM